MCCVHVRSFGSKRRLRVIELFSEKTMLFVMLAGDSKLMCINARLLMCAVEEHTVCRKLMLWMVCLGHIRVGIRGVKFSTAKILNAD